VRHECESREFVRAREDDGGYVGDRWAEGEFTTVRRRCSSALRRLCGNISDMGVNDTVWDVKQR
jgi:hypothetical protein